MRVVGWVLFAATCGMVVLQGLILATAGYSMTSYEVVVDHVFPLLGIGAIVGAGVGALVVWRYPGNPPRSPDESRDISDRCSGPSLPSPSCRRSS
ncbi:hypothetical protein [Nakamurella multipartita]|uniref:Uncharacterized protein n=1 Tax=Nakamurella multipartita (strain ATCC 700099 / DSM 44233 / CIP 104796 / JCM 9543 / NBRC 105858 / Y-104) TaxID=479431 RepID=C8X7N8_NAKMY|nr:hypothetical protein [Nakamurella multipartita]ACV78991.1 hypothetical protein Namu_2642 [Nakamurella multipartita DSM 44233]